MKQSVNLAPQSLGTLFKDYHNSKVTLAHNIFTWHSYVIVFNLYKAVKKNKNL